MLLERYCSTCSKSVSASDETHVCPDCGGPLGEPMFSGPEHLEQTAVYTPAEMTPDLDLCASLPGRQLAHYFIQSFLGKGGMAWVFLARHSTLERPCAIKVLCPTQRDRSAVQRFLSEARAAAALVHPHIVTVHNIGEALEHPYIELEYVPGRSLKRLAVEQRPLAPLTAITLLGQACAGLAEAHRSGFIHRDFKPANILLRDDRFAKLADFGLAKRVGRGPAEQGLLGTPYYMAPELFQTQAATTRSDVYAVGVSLFYLLAGRYPFEGRYITELMRLHATAAVPDVRQWNEQVPEVVVQLIESCLAKNPEDRPPDAMHLAEELTGLLRGLRPLEDLVAEALTGMPIRWERRTKLLCVVVDTEPGRSQHVFIEEAQDEVSQALVRIYSVCAPIEERWYRRALELNAVVPHGSLAIRPVDGRLHFVMLDTYPRATCDVEEIRRSVQQIARWSDWMEDMLTQQDRH